MACLREIVRDYRVEMEDLMVGDRQLAQEIEFDLRQYEEGERKGTRVKSSDSDLFKTPFPKV
jgi:hypothetical protein